MFFEISLVVPTGSADISFAGEEYYWRPQGGLPASFAGIAMARSEDGEFELVLGNKQLLSVFFIVVVLLGVFFTMGYIVGKNSASSEVLAARGTEPIVVDPTARAKETPQGAVVVDPRTSASPGKPSPVEVKPERATPEPVAEPPLVTKREPPAQTAKPEPAPAQKAPPVAPAKPEPVKTEAVKPPSSPGKAVLLPSGEPAPGQQFLQVVASTKQDCEMVADLLRRKGFSVVVAPKPGDTLYRVLVGPLADAAAVSKTRSELEQAGFEKPYLRKY